MTEADLKIIARNIRIVTFSARIVILMESGNERTLPVSKARLAVNTEMDVLWQVECHLITKYRAIKFAAKTTIHD